MMALRTMLMRTPGMGGLCVPRPAERARATQYRRMMGSTSIVIVPAALILDGLQQLGGLMALGGLMVLARQPANCMPDAQPDAQPVAGQRAANSLALVAQPTGAAQPAQPARVETKARPSMRTTTGSWMSAIPFACGPEKGT